MSASWQMVDTRYGVRRSLVIPFFSYISHLCPPLTADKPHCVPQCSSSPLTSSPFSFRSPSCGYTSSFVIGGLGPPLFLFSNHCSLHRCSHTHPGWSNSAFLRQFMNELRHKSLNQLPALALYLFIPPLSPQFPRAAHKHHHLNPSPLLHLDILQSYGSMH